MPAGWSLLAGPPAGLAIMICRGFKVLGSRRMVRVLRNLYGEQRNDYGSPDQPGEQCKQHQKHIWEQRTCWNFKKQVRLCYKHQILKIHVNRYIHRISEKSVNTILFTHTHTHPTKKKISNITCTRDNGTFCPQKWLRIYCSKMDTEICVNIMIQGSCTLSAAYASM